MTPPVEVEELLTVIGESTGPRTRVRDVSILFSAAARPESAVLSKRTFESTSERTAALLHAIIRWEPLDMWNASFGWQAARLIARSSGGDLAMPGLDRMILTNDILDGREDDVTEIAKRLAPYLRTE